MSASQRQLHRPRRAARGAVRQDDADPGRGCSPEWYRLVLESRRRRAGDPMEAKLALARFIVARCARGGGGASGPRPTSRAWCARARRPRRCRRRRSRTAIPSTCRRCSSSAFGMSTSEARRLIAQGGVRVNDEVVSELDVPRAPLAGALVQAGKRRLRFALDSGLSRCYHAPAASREAAVGKSPKRPGEPFERAGYEQVSESLRGLRESEAFLRPAPGGAVFENSTACVYVETRSAPFAAP